MFPFKKGDRVQTSQLPIAKMMMDFKVGVKVEQNIENKDVAVIFTDTDSKTFFPRPKFPIPKPRLFSRQNFPILRLPNIGKSLKTEISHSGTTPTKNRTKN